MNSDWGVSLHPFPHHFYPNHRPSVSAMGNISPRTYCPNHVNLISLTCKKGDQKPNPHDLQEVDSQLIANHLVVPILLKSLKLPFPKWYDLIALCDYHTRILSHSTENYILFKYNMQGLVRSGALNFDRKDEPCIARISLLEHMENWYSVELYCFLKNLVG